MSGRIDYPFEGIRAGGQAQHTSAAHVEALRESLRSQMNSLAANWNSQSASEAQQNAHHQWNAVNQEVDDALRQSGSTTISSGENMQSTESANARMFHTG